VWLWLRDNLQLIPGVGPLWKLILGLVFIILVTALRRGICGEIRHAWVSRRHATLAANAVVAAAASATESAPVMPLAAPLIRVRQDVPALETHDLAKHYGGLRAVAGVSFAVRSNSIHAVIGPNGAGKSTLFKMLLDEVEPTEGEVRLHGRRITGLGATRTAQLGIGKSNQLNHLFLELTARENLRIAALARRRGPFRLDVLRRADSLPQVEQQIEAVLATMDLGDRADIPSHILAYGEKRRLEIGLALATGPHVLLLDEPLAGMSPAERTTTRALIRNIGRDRTLVIVEHDMDAVFELAERITVMYEGSVLAEGTPDEIQRNPAVQDAYLGGLHEHEPA
jgi:branched-chain amino acid transport system permease protein